MPTSSSTTRIWFADIRVRGLSGRLWRQNDAHVRPVGLHVLDEDTAVVLVDDLLHDGEPETGTLGLRRHVGLEDASHDAFGNPGAIIAHREQDAAGSLAGGHQDAWIIDAGQGVDRVL